VQVNGVLARLSDQVRPGDVVEVITSGSRIAPSEDWLNYSNSSTTRLLQACWQPSRCGEPPKKAGYDSKRCWCRTGCWRWKMCAPWNATAGITCSNAWPAPTWKTCTPPSAAAPSAWKTWTAP
jgi:hypothetical protein